mmetsp:Transcript_27698/g.50670  ORF Transcript_27698/g.50670 Transcript_27698/m.50670 type:complete len:216 (-) Transcript_27698:588-1235(-)
MRVRRRSRMRVRRRSRMRVRRRSGMRARRRSELPAGLVTASTPTTSRRSLKAPARRKVAGVRTMTAARLKSPEIGTRIEVDSVTRRNGIRDDEDRTVVHQAPPIATRKRKIEKPERRRNSASLKERRILHERSTSARTHGADLAPDLEGGPGGDHDPAADLERDYAHTVDIAQGHRPSRVLPPSPHLQHLQKRQPWQSKAQHSPSPRRAQRAQVL